MDSFLNDGHKAVSSARTNTTRAFHQQSKDKSVAMHIPRQSQSSICAAALAYCHLQGPRGRWDPGDLKGIRIDKAGVKCVNTNIYTESSIEIEAR
jgi:hypothetical protein